VFSVLPAVSLYAAETWKIAIGGANRINDFKCDATDDSSTYVGKSRSPMTAVETKVKCKE